MGEESSKTTKSHKKRRLRNDDVSPSQSHSSSEDDRPSKRRKNRRHKSSRRDRSGSSSRNKNRDKSDRDRDRKSRSKRRKYSSSSSESERDNYDRKSGSRRRRDSSKRKYSSSDSEDDNNNNNEFESCDPVDVVKDILKEFPAVAGDLEQLLRMIDDGQAVDIGGLSERSLVKHLRKLFLSLKLKEKGNLVFLLPSGARPTLEVVGDIIRPSNEQRFDSDVPQNGTHPVSQDEAFGQKADDFNVPFPPENVDFPKKRTIGPEMPSAELLAAAAKLTDAEAELRQAEMDDDAQLFIGPPPPAVVSEAESANDAERFEEVTRIMGAEAENPYDIVGVNRKMSAENIKKRYWKLSLMVHPDKCPHPEAHQAFIKLNKAFKDLQDPDKRKAMDDKIDLKEEQERFKIELKAMREAAQWRRLQGISMEGDDALLADLDVKIEPRRDEWMTTLPPERKPGMTMQSTKFSRNTKEGRGDTSAWTDTPSERAQKAKMSYLEAYNEAAALAAANDQETNARNADAELVDKYNKAKRSKTLVEKHQEATRSRSKKKSKQEKEDVKEGWEGQHPWKPWDREKDLTAGRMSVKLDSEDMAQGLSSRFSSGSFQRNFL